MQRQHLLLLLLAVTTVWKTVTSLEVETSSTDQPEDFPYNGAEVFGSEASPDEILVISGEDDELAQMSDEEILAQHPTLKAPHRLSIDRLCSSSNVVDGVCTVKDMTLRFSTDTFYKTDYSMVFDNSRIKCLTITYKPCTIMLTLNGGKDSYLELKNESKVSAKQIIIEALQSRVTIGEGSTLWSSGQSIVMAGTQNNNLGATFIGQSGFCGEINGFDTEHMVTYGSYDRTPDYGDITKYDQEMGSIGKPNDVETAGGGRVIILSDSVVFKGDGAKIQANARPYSDFKPRRYGLPGGSGGYIYIHTKNEHKDNEVSSDSRIEAKGGYSHGDFTAGSGGVVVFDGGFTVPQHRVVTNGGIATRLGTSSSVCANGASGTVYRAHEDSLFVDNQGLETKAKTTLKIPESRIENSSKGKPELASKLTVQGKGHVLIKGEHTAITFVQLSIYDGSAVQLGETDELLHVRLRQDAHIARNGLLDFSKTKNVLMIQDIQTDTEGKYGTLTLGNILIGDMFAVKADHVSVIGAVHPIISRSKSEVHATKFIVEAKNLTVFETGSSWVGFNLMQANDTLVIKEGAKLTSSKAFTCNSATYGHDLFTCMGPYAPQADKLDLTDVVARFKQMYPHYGPWEDSQHMVFENLWGGLEKLYTSYFISMGKIQLDGAYLEGPRVGICGADVEINNSIIDANGHGCPSDYGMRKGQLSGGCAGSGGSNGGHGGAGGIRTTADSVKEFCHSKTPEPYMYGSHPNREGSGGASGTPGAYLGGAGGGIIRLNVLNELRLSRSTITANGLSGVEGERGSGGGAGGTIAIQTRHLKGESKIEAAGGQGSGHGGGGGSGGRLVISYNSGFSASAQPHQSHFWRGSYSLAGGQAGYDSSSNSWASGTDGQEGVINSEKCFSGYSGPFCQPCPVGTYKYDYSYAICKPCENKPENSFYTQIAAASAHCPYECSAGLDPVEVNAYCLSALELQVDRLGGATTALIFFASLMVLTLFIWIALIAHSKWILRSDKSFRSVVYDGVLFNSDAEVDPSEDIVGPRNLKMHDSDIWSHSHRMYLLGENSISFPWYVPKDFPSRALNPENKDKFIRFTKSRQETISWTGIQKDTYVLMRCLCPPISNLIHKCFRKRHFNSLQDQIYEAFDSSFWDSRNKGRTIRVSSSTADNQLAYIDFLDYEKSKKDYIGPQLPITLMLAGSGTFNSPYTLNFEDDALAKSIVYFNQATLKEPLPLWFENLNTLLSKMSFYKMQGSTTRDLAQVIDWIEMGNKTLFNPLDTKATLYVFENSYQAVEGGTFKQRRRSFPLESLVFETFPEMFSNLIHFVQCKLMAKKSEIRLGLVFKPYTDEKRRSFQERIRRVAQQQKQAESMNLNNSSSTQGMLIFAKEGEETENGEEFSYAKVNVRKGSDRRKAALGDIRRDQNMLESNTDLLDETNMESSEVFIYGSGSGAQQVKIIDKSKRAYDISHDAIESFELALRKPKRKCSHKMVKCRGWWYALWVLFFKHHGIPPKSGTRYQYFLGFSIFIALDALLTFHLVVHMFQPMSNWKLYGIPYFFMLPGMTVLGPICGILACLIASASLLKFMGSVNATAVLMNYPLTFALMVLKNDEPFYVSLVILLWFNKIAISFFGAKVRQHLINPGFCRNAEKIEERFNSYIQAKQEVDAGVKPGMSAEERAASLAEFGPPKVGLDSDSEELSDNEEDTSFGIIPKGKLLPKVEEDEREQLSGF